MKYFVFYHRADLDGQCSAALLFHYLKGQDVTFYGVNHGDTDLPKLINRITPDSTTYVVDFSFSLELTQSIQAKSRLIWIDHHKSAIKSLGSLTIEGVRSINNSQSACELLFEYLYPKRPLPQTIKLISANDTHLYKQFDKDSAYEVTVFQAGLHYFDMRNFKSDLWMKVLMSKPEFIDEVKAIGNTLYTYNAKEFKELVELYGFDLEFEGLKCLALNTSIKSSKIFDSVIHKYDMCIKYFQNAQRIWEYTFYTDERIDASEIALRFQGGGHLGAAGCRSINLLF